MAADPNSQSDLTLDELANDGDAFLLPDEPKINDRVQAVKWIEKRWKELFEYLLNDSIIDETLVASQPQPQDVSPVVPHRVLFRDLGT